MRIVVNDFSFFKLPQAAANAPSVNPGSGFDLALGDPVSRFFPAKSFTDNEVQDPRLKG
jgi:hypothetical protein